MPRIGRVLTGLLSASGQPAVDVAFRQLVLRRGAGLHPVGRLVVEPRGDGSVGQVPDPAVHDELLKFVGLGDTGRGDFYASQGPV